MSDSKPSGKISRNVDVGQSSVDPLFPMEKQGGVKPHNTGTSRPPEPQGSGGSSAENSKK